jgi:hypothetical protein
MFRAVARSRCAGTARGLGFPLYAVARADTPDLADVFDDP